MCELIVHKRIHREHTELAPEDVIFAWHHSYYEALREDSPTSLNIFGLDVTRRDVNLKWWGQ